MDVMRLNFSHGTHTQKAQVIDYHIMNNIMTMTLTKTTTPMVASTIATIHTGD
jgi:pyruvate kinase